jgi:UDP-2,3-diacylglucosamine hydrolase
MTTLFVSDLHLANARPAQLSLFIEFLACVARRRARALYILGDLFEVWLGDDDDTPPNAAVVAALAALTAAGVELYVGYGNRDFLYGARFIKATGARLLDDYAVIDLYGTPTLVTHGDLLCTRDIKYQRFRRLVRHPLTRRAFLATPLAWRQRIAHRTRSGTVASMRRKDDAVMDVEESTVADIMLRHQVNLLIHGHTHRPAFHDYEDGERRRIVLGDWYEQDSVLVCDAEGQRALRVSAYLTASTASN